MSFKYLTVQITPDVFKILALPVNPFYVDKDLLNPSPIPDKYFFCQKLTFPLFLAIKNAAWHEFEMSVSDVSSKKGENCHR
jgi:hypothetical protein